MRRRERARPTRIRRRARRTSAARGRRSRLVAGYIPEVNILNGCNLAVNEGEFVGIIGPNGAGKSTLLKAVLGLCTVRSGTIVTLGDRDITGMQAHELVALGVGYVPQTRNVFPSLTVRENLEMGCFLAPVDVRRALRVRHRAVPAAGRAGRRSGPARCRAASGRWSRWGGR